MKLKELARRVLITACLIVIGTVLASALIVPIGLPSTSRSPEREAGESSISG